MLSIGRAHPGWGQRMETIEDAGFEDMVRLAEITSDAVALCGLDGTILHVNRQFLVLIAGEREQVVGQDIKDFVYSDVFERAENHELPFTLDGSSNELMLKLTDGSFIPVAACALPFNGRDPGAAEDAGRVMVALRSLEERYTADRRQGRLVAELRAANKRLSGTLSIIMSTIGSNNLPALLETVLNSMVEALDASGATVYFAEGGGFKLRALSKGLADSYVPDFIPYGAGIPTYVLRASKPCRISVIPAARATGAETGVFYDIDDRRDHKLRFQDTPPFKALIAVPVFFGTQVLGVVELGWSRPCTPREYDVRVLEVVCDYLSIELVGMVSSIRAARIAELERSLNRIRDILFTGAEAVSPIWSGLSTEICTTLSCHLCPVLYDPMNGRYVIDFEGGDKVALPGSIEEAFFSETAPAARVGAAAQGQFLHEDKNAMDLGEFELKNARIVRVDRASRTGRLLRRAGMPSQGVFVDLGLDPLPAPAGQGPAASDSPAPSSAALARREAVRPNRMFLLLRSASQEPIDDIEFDYLTHLVHDIEAIGSGVRRHQTEQHIAQTLQAGMRNTLGSVPGIATDALYSSATSQALVGGDFYTLIRLPDEQAVMILGDASGKGIEAASMSALAKTALSAYAWEGESPAQMASSLNSMLMSFSRPETFVTAFIGKIDLRRGELTYCSAGHPPAMLVHPSEEGSEVEPVSVQSGVMGAFETMPFENGSLSFSQGDLLFMYTDGVIEARDPAGDFFGELRLREVLLHAGAQGVEGICARVLDALDAFTASVMDDDIAMVALEFEEGRG